MTSRFPRLEILPPAQKLLWPAFRALEEFGFVLYGGTAVALHLGHRESADFDFFTDHSFQPTSLFTQLPFLARGTILQEGLNTLTVLVPSGDAGKEHVKLSFFGGLTFGRLGEPRLTPDGVIEVAALDDLLAHKLKVMLQRVELKDYVDIDAILISGQPLSGGLAGAQALFRNQFPVQEPLKALTYFKDGKLGMLPDDVKKRLVEAASQVRRIEGVEIASRRLSARKK